MGSNAAAESTADQQRWGGLEMCWVNFFKSELLFHRWLNWQIKKFSAAVCVPGVWHPVFTRVMCTRMTCRHHYMFHLVLSNKQSDCRGHPTVPVNPDLPVVLPLTLVLGWFCPVSSPVQSVCRSVTTGSQGCVWGVSIASQVFTGQMMCGQLEFFRSITQ